MQPCADCGAQRKTSPQGSPVEPSGFARGRDGRTARAFLRFKAMLTDPIANMLTSIRNAVAARKNAVRVPFSRLKQEIAEVLRKAEYVGPVTVATEDRRKELEITLLYSDAGQPQIRGIERVSKPGRRWYARRSELPRVLSGLGIAVLSTSRGLMTDAEARKRGIGGEVICKVW